MNTPINKTVFILNPQSAGGATRRRFERLRHLIRDLGEVDVWHTEKTGHATDLCRRAIEEGADLIVSVGGDGTNNEVLNGFYDAEGKRLGAEVRMGWVGSGTGGDLRRTLGWPADPAADLRRLAQGADRRLDIGRITFRNEVGDRQHRYFLNVASCGLSGLVDDLANKSSKSLGATGTFFASTVRGLLKHQAQSLKLSYDDEPPTTGKFMLVAVGNGRCFGAGMKIAPHAELDDGLLDVVTVGEGGMGLWIRHGLKVYQGKHLDLEAVTNRRCRKLKAEAEDPGERVLIAVAGEQPGRLPMEVENLPGALIFRDDPKT
jgi:YegS/Rv2252/BmrU family lipid kinase